MKTLIYIAFAAFLLLCGGCNNTNTKQEEPATTPQNNTLKEHKPRQLRDPFRPDHPTRAEVEAEKEKRELDLLDQEQKKESPRL